MTAHPFRLVLDETRPTSELPGLLGEHITFFSPVLVHPVRDRELVALIVQTALNVITTRTVTAELRADHRTLVLFAGRVGNEALEAACQLRDDAAGTLGQLKVLMRPLPAVEAFRHEMGLRPPSMTE